MEAILEYCLVNNLVLQALDTFNTAIVSPIYYAMFTTLTILASAIMFKVCQIFLWLHPSLLVSSSLAELSFTINIIPLFHQDWSGQSASNIASEICGFVTVISGTTVLHSTRGQDQPPNAGKHIYQLLWSTSCLS